MRVGLVDRRKSLIKLLKNRQEILATAESCTGGMIASLLISIPGTSDVIKESFVTYAEETKSSLLDIDLFQMQRHGVVSYNTAEAMVRGLREKYQCDLAIASTGVAGPGNDGDILQGTVYLAVSYRNLIKVQKFHFKGTRNLVRIQASLKAIELANTIVEGFHSCE